MFRFADISSFVMTIAGSWLVGVFAFSKPQSVQASCGDYLLIEHQNLGNIQAAGGSQAHFIVAGKPSKRTCHGPGCSQGSDSSKFLPTAVVKTTRRVVFAALCTSMNDKALLIELLCFPESIVAAVGFSIAIIFI